MHWEDTATAVHVALVVASLLFLRARRRLRVQIIWASNSARVELGVEDLAEVGYFITAREVQV